MFDHGYNYFHSLTIIILFPIFNSPLTLQAPILQNGQTHLNTEIADELYECVWPIYEISAKRVKKLLKLTNSKI